MTQTMQIFFMFPGYIKQNYGLMNSSLRHVLINSSRCSAFSGSGVLGLDNCLLPLLSEKSCCLIIDKITYITIQRKFYVSDSFVKAVRARMSDYITYPCVNAIIHPNPILDAGMGNLLVNVTSAINNTLTCAVVPPKHLTFFHMGLPGCAMIFR